MIAFRFAPLLALPRRLEPLKTTVQHAVEGYGRLLKAIRARDDIAETKRETPVIVHLIPFQPLTVVARGAVYQVHTEESIETRVTMEGQSPISSAHVRFEDLLRHLAIQQPLQDMSEQLMRVSLFIGSVSPCRELGEGSVLNSLVDAVSGQVDKSLRSSEAPIDGSKTKRVTKKAVLGSSGADVVEMLGNGEISHRLEPVNKQRSMH